ncbi:pseudaminic acid cytidylyltransferase [Prochlorococcus marinus str. MU1402]|uniref:pseudaminic acid cytidylyltransferase n=1 Tax=Prochlorococcus marinus TaxID=1219 RepID=UPI001ADB70AC|nr:pseudaminic acid cytidylyltransferase [Prochlorococcus marinus]MBO8232374.1 pseudaminic acid cytidylyltransferase [Prochlorococcus marinus XMU1402]MBW3057102.1 pseudaminic acid cytidylyltransferase [Prochlorococcus marinus str. MU1402]
MNICVIPARGGSKRIPKKNIRLFCGKPIIKWSIEAALKSECFDKVIVSTDCDEISAISKNFGAEVPFIRPTDLSDDHTPTIPVLKHAIDFVNKQYGKVEYACCIYATAPFIESKYIKLGLKKIADEKANFAFSATSFPFPIQRAIKIDKNNRSLMFFPQEFNTRSQDLESCFHDAAQFYWGRASAWLSNKNIFQDNSLPIIIPRYKVQDIDNEEDWLRAEMMFKSLNY